MQAYFSLDEKSWDRDLPFIEKVDQYLKTKGFPQKEASAPERSYEMMEDEKWIDFKGVKELFLYLPYLWRRLEDCIEYCYAV